MIMSPDILRSRRTLPLPLLLLMSAITFMAILCELVPSGLLPVMARGMHVQLTQAGQLIGIYALASAVCGLPLVSFTVACNRKTLLLFLLGGFSLSNFIVAWAPDFNVALVGRALGGACAGTLWPMITAYGMTLAPVTAQGRAVTIIMGGITAGMAVGVPFLTFIGNYYGYRAAILILACLILLIAVLCFFYLPSVAGEKKAAANSPWTMLKNRGVLLVVLLTFLAVGANYGVYTFITDVVRDLGYPGVNQAQLLFGIGSIISVCLAIKLIDRYLPVLLIGIYVTGILVFLGFAQLGQIYLLDAGFLLWGISFGSLSSIFQTATSKQVSSGVAVANALQSASFNFSIMFGSFGAGKLLEQSNSKIMLYAAAVLLISGLLIALVNRRKMT